MSFSIGIVGLPNVGKSTLFRALTKNPVDISNYPFCTVEPNVGIVEVPDKRLEKLAEISKPKKTIPAIVKFVDVAGLVKGAAKGEGLGNQFLAHLRETDALLHIVRCFEKEEVSHVDGEINAKRDVETVKSELILKDLETIEKRLQKIEKAVSCKEAEIEREILNNLKNGLNQEKTAAFLLNNQGEGQESEKKNIIENLFLLTAKPQIYLLNCSEQEIPNELREELEKENSYWMQLNLKDELDISELNEEERKELEMEESKLVNLIKKCYQVLNLITFFTLIGIEETRAWPIKERSTVLEGAGKIHSDFKDKFIMAEVINWQKFLKAGSWQKCRELGILKKVGRDYLLEDGDIIEVKHS